jgi:hypothetical protein
MGNRDSEIIKIAELKISAEILIAYARAIFLFPNIVTFPPPPPPIKKLRVDCNSPAKKLSLQLKTLRSSVRN